MARRRFKPQINRNAQMRATSRGVGANMPFQGGLGLNRNVPGSQQPLPGVQTSGDVSVNDPTTGRRGPCPPGMAPGKDPNTGAKTCVPSARRAGGAPRRPGAGIPGPNNNVEGY